MSKEAKRTTIYLSQEDVKVIENRAKTKKLSFSKAAIDLIYEGIGRKKHETTKIEEHEKRLHDYENLLEKYESRILKLEQKMQRLTELIAATRIGEIRDYFVWDRPPKQQIPIYLWSDCTDPNQTESEKYGLMKYDLIQKLFGDVGRSLFQNWCKKLNFNEEQQKDYLCQISGAEYRQVKIPGNERASNRYLINHLFQTDHLFQAQEDSQPSSHEG